MRSPVHTLALNDVTANSSKSKVPFGSQAAYTAGELRREK